MGSSSKQQPVVTTQSNQPWANAQPALDQALGNASSLFANDVGYKPWAGATQAALDPRSTESLQMTEQLARTMPNLGVQANGVAGGILGNMGISESMQPSLRTLQATANGESLGVINPALQSMLDTNSQKAMDMTGSIASGMGRYGSGAHTAAAAKAITDATAPILAQNYQSERDRQLASAGSLAGIYGQGQDRALQTAAMGGAINDLAYDPAQRIGGIGDFYSGRAQDALGSQIELWNAQQARPWEQVARLNAIASGQGGLGGTSTSVKPYSGPSSAQRAIGGAASGAALGSMLGPWGTGVGALGGGLLGMFG
jgi:hypothetical protein